MTRLTPEREAEIRELYYCAGNEDIDALLAEVDALRAELAAVERHPLPAKCHACEQNFCRCPPAPTRWVGDPDPGRVDTGSADTAAELAREEDELAEVLALTKRDAFDCGNCDGSGQVHDWSRALVDCGTCNGTGRV